MNLENRKRLSWQQEGEVYVQQNPLKAVVTALAAGFVLGLLIRKN